MIELLKNIFLHADYKLISNQAGVVHFSKDEQAHYFVLEIPLSELLNLKSVSSFRENSELYKHLRKEFNRIVEQESSAAEKNSSLIFLIEVDSLEELERSKQQILLLEEDENYFKKYVILYSQNAINDLALEMSIEEYQQKISNQTNFTRYFEDGYMAELEEYLFLLQLFVKLPFLKLKSGDEAFKELDIRIKEELGNPNYIKYNQILSMKEKIIEFDFENGLEDKLDHLLNILNDD